MIIIDLEIITLVCLIIILIYNYYTTECYRVFKSKKVQIINDYGDEYNYYNKMNPQPDTFSNIVDNTLNMKNPKIELSGFYDQTDANNSTITDPQQLPDNVILNDRYNDFITPYTDEQLNGVITEAQSTTFSSDYSQSLVDDLQKNIIFDMQNSKVPYACSFKLIFFNMFVDWKFFFLRK